jgi:ATP-dependent DNA ligase
MVNFRRVMWLPSISASPPSPRLDLAGYKRPMLPFKPCLPTAAPVPPSAPDWLHEIKHDGYRIVALRNGERVRLISRRGLDWAWRIPVVTAAIKALPVRSCVIDGEVIACDGNGLADFELLRSRRHDDPAIFRAFDLLERDGRDLRYGPIEERKADLAWLLTSCRPAIVLNRRRGSMAARGDRAAGRPRRPT